MVLETLAGLLTEYGDLVQAAWIIALTFLVGKSVLFALNRWTQKEGEGPGRHVFGEIKVPFYLVLALVGFYYSAKSVEILTPYRALIQDAFVVGGVLLGAYIVRKAVNGALVWYASKDSKFIKIEKTSLMSLRNLASIFIFAIAAMIILGQFGVEITPLLASLGIGGLAIALALQPTLSNYFAGMYIASDKTVRLGDYIEVNQDQRGYVEKMTWRSVWIRTISNNMIIVPNSKLAESIVVNYDQPGQPMWLWIPVGVAYSSDLDKVERTALKVAKKVARETGTGMEDSEPFVRYNEFGDSNIKFNMVFSIKKYDKQFELRDEFVKALKKEFNKKGIEISFPCVNLYKRST